MANQKSPPEHYSKISSRANFLANLLLALAFGHSFQLFVCSKMSLLRTLTQLFLLSPPLRVVLVGELLVASELNTLQVIVGCAIKFIREGGFVVMDPTSVDVDSRCCFPLRGISSQILSSSALYCC